MTTNQELMSLLDHRINLLQNVNNIGIVWWTTTIVFSVSIIGMLWKERERLKEFSEIKYLYFVVWSFYISVIGFGMWMIYSIWQLEKESMAIASELNIPNHLIYNYGFFGAKIGFLIGTTNFIVISFFWWRITKALNRFINTTPTK